MSTLPLFFPFKCPSDLRAVLCHHLHSLLKHRQLSDLLARPLFLLCPQKSSKISRKRLLSLQCAPRLLHGSPFLIMNCKIIFLVRVSFTSFFQIAVPVLPGALPPAHSFVPYSMHNWPIHCIIPSAVWCLFPAIILQLSQNQR